MATATATTNTTPAITRKSFVRRWISGKARRWRLVGSGFRWKRLNLQFSFFRDVLFRILTFFETIVLVASLCLFYCFCGCRF